MNILRIFDKNKRFMIYYFLKRWIIVGNETDLIRSLVYALRDADGLKEIELGITHEDNKTLYRYDYSQGKGRK